MIQKNLLITKIWGYLVCFSEKCLQGKPSVKVTSTPCLRQIRAVNRSLMEQVVTLFDGGARCIDTVKGQLRVHHWHLWDFWLFALRSSSSAPSRPWRDRLGHTLLVYVWMMRLISQGLHFWYSPTLYWIQNKEGEEPFLTMFVIYRNKITFLFACLFCFVFLLLIASGEDRFPPVWDPPV